MALMSPLDIVELKLDNKLEYELTIELDPDKLDRSSTKVLTVPTAPPPPPPPPQAVSISDADVAKNAFLNLLGIFMIVNSL
jgi:hypothetical protein